MTYYEEVKIALFGSILIVGIVHNGGSSHGYYKLAISAR